MAFRRACSYQATIQPPEAPVTYSAVLVTFQQNGNNIINKNLSDLTVGANEFTVKLTQEETSLFKAGVQAWLQIRCFASEYNAPGSVAWPIDVLPALNDQILEDPAEE